MRAIRFTAAAAILTLYGCGDVVVETTGETNESLSEAIVTPDTTNKPKAGDVLVVGGLDSSFKSSDVAEFFDPATRKFLRTGSLGTGRAGLEAVPLSAHRVLVAGGFSGKAKATGSTLTVTSSVVATAQVYAESTGKFAKPAKLEGRAVFTETVLQDGTVLLAGGFDPFGKPLDTAQIYSPSTGKFTATKGDMTMPRASHAATLLPDGTVLITGGIVNDSANTTSTAELYTPSTGKFTALGSQLAGTLAGHTSTLITGCGCALNNKVLIVAGVIGVTSSGFNFLETNSFSQIYDPVTKTFSGGGTFTVMPRALHTATLLQGGKVLIAGGMAGATYIVKNKFTGYNYDTVQNSAEIFDPTTGQFTCVGGKNGLSCVASMTSSRATHSATAFTSGPLAGQVLLAGGFGAPTSNPTKFEPLATAELFDPVHLTFAKTGAMSSAHMLHGAALLP